MSVILGSCTHFAHIKRWWLLACIYITLVYFKLTAVFFWAVQGGEPFFTVWAFEVDSRPIRNEPVVVFRRVLVEVCWASDAFIVRHIVRHQATTNYKLCLVGFLTGHPVEVKSDTFGGFTKWTFLHAPKIAPSTDKECWQTLFQRLQCTLLGKA